MAKLLRAAIYKKVPNSQSEVELLESGVTLPVIHIEDTSSSESTLYGYVNNFPIMRNGFFLHGKA